MVVENLFIELSLILVIAVVISGFMKLLKQPLIIGYIIAGIIVSPSVLNLIQSGEGIGTFAQMGVAILLFMVGLNLEPRMIKDVGLVSLVTGLGQLIFTFGIGFLISLALGFNYLTSAYISIALAFSSTIIIMKLLSDKGDTSTLYGKISIGFLIVQDLVAILILMVISSFDSGASFSSIAFQKVGIGIGLIVGIFLFSIIVLKPATKLMAKSQELLLLFSIGWAFAIASLFDFVGFSIEIGALLAGISLSVSPYRYEISSRMRPLRDFFLLIFFILLGSQLEFGDVTSSITPIIILSLFVLIGNPLIVMTLMGRMGYTKRNSFLAGLTVSQISEFSFILIALAIVVGHVESNVLSLITVIGLITMAGSSYAIINGNKIYSYLSNYLRVFERRDIKVDEGKFYREDDYDIILFGYNRIGYSLKKSFRKTKKKFLIVDNNPDTILDLVKNGVSCRYGDAEDPELLADLPLKNAKMIISTIPEFDGNLFLIKKIKEVNEKASILVVSHRIDEALDLYKAGATYVITPHFFGGLHTANLIEKHGFDRDKFEKEAMKHSNDLLERKKEGHKDVAHERD